MSIQVTLEIDTNKLFDSLRMVDGRTDMLSDRLVGLLLTGKAPTSDLIGMAFYGITHIKTQGKAVLDGGAAIAATEVTDGRP